MKNVFERVADFEIIDFHTHPFSVNNNICAYKKEIDMSGEDMIEVLRSCGISAMCGSVIQVDDRNDYPTVFEKNKAANRAALELREKLGGFYIPGFHINPDFVDESIEEIGFMHENGVNLIGELVPYHDEWDSFAVQTLRSWKDKEFRSVLDQEIEEGAAKRAEEAADAHKNVFDFLKEILGEQVADVKASARLKSHPVCLTAGEGLSFEMEKYFQSIEGGANLKAQRILELNVEHPVFEVLEAAVSADPEKAKKYAVLLYNQAQLIAGLPLEDPAGYTDLVCELMK